MVVLPRIGTTTLNTSVDVVVETTGVGVFFLAHHSLVPPHGQGPAKLMVIVSVVLLLVQPVCTNDAVAVIVPGAHLDVKHGGAAWRRERGWPELLAALTESSGRAPAGPASSGPASSGPAPD